MLLAVYLVCSAYLSNSELAHHPGWAVEKRPLMGTQNRPETRQYIFGVDEFVDGLNYNLPLARIGGNYSIILESNN